MSSTEPRAKIAVFIDFDNIEIGVKSTLGSTFDVGVVLDAIKERGEVVTKVAYSDWKRAGDHSRQLTQHAIRMVQRNMTPGGDKNGADITMALDALEMAFTHDHINTFVIVGGDSDFMPLVEKLKQYDRKVLVCGGRQFTSVILQKNCHEFIAYENLIGRGGRASERGGRGGSASQGSRTGDVTAALPLVQRALKVLSEREVSPQLGLLKSTLLQLDSTFSEKDYGASSFRDFIEKVAESGIVTLKHAGRNLLVEPAESESSSAIPESPVHAEPAEAPAPRTEPVHQPRRHEPPQAAAAPAAEGGEAPASHVPLADASTNAEGIRQLQAALQRTAPPRWPMYIRQMKQYLRTAIENFDERRFGFASLVDLLRAAGREGVLRLERDRQGAVRVFPGAKLAAAARPLDPDIAAAEAAIAEATAAIEARRAAVFAPDVVDVAPIQELAEPSVVDATPEPGNEAERGPEPAGRKTRGRKAAAGGGGRKKTAAPAARKPAVRKSAPRRRKATEEQ